MNNLENSIEQYHQNLRERIQSWLKNERGLSNEIIENGHLDPHDKSVEEIFPKI